MNPPVTRSRTRGREDPPPGAPDRPPRAQRGPLTERQRRLRQRALPLAIVALIAFIFGVISAAGSPEQDMAKRFVKDWAHQDYKSMHDELSDSAQAQYSAADLSRAYRGRPAGLHRDRDRSGQRRRPEERQRHGRRRRRRRGADQAVRQGRRDSAAAARRRQGRLEPESDLPRICRPASGSVVVSSWAGARRSSPSTTSRSRTGPVDNRISPARLGRDRRRRRNRGSPIPSSRRSCRRPAIPRNEDTGVSGLELAFNAASLRARRAGSCWRSRTGTPATDVPGGHARAGSWRQRTERPGSRSERRSTRTSSRPP